MVYKLLTIEECTSSQLTSLDDCDIALLNLIAASGLPGTEELDVDLYMATLDEWAERVKQEIWRHIYRYDFRSTQSPTEFSYGNSIGRFFCWYMLQVLQEDCGVAYHPDRKNDPDFCNPKDIFIHGIIDEKGQGGTCASMPVVYVAIGRRIGLPVHLVQTKSHLFFRWEDSKGTTIHWETPDLKLWIPPERFNVEGSGEGIAFYNDAHYLQHPVVWEETDFEQGWHLRSHSATETLAGFLIQRGECFYDLGNFDECLKAIYFARQLAPDDKRYERLHAHRSKQYNAVMDQQHERLMEINERNRQAIAKRHIPSPKTSQQIVKVAHGTMPPIGLPPGTQIRYVPRDQADLLPGGKPTLGRIYKVAMGQPRPACLPPTAQVQFVPPHQADDFSEYEKSPMSAMQQHLERQQRIQQQNQQLHAQQTIHNFQINGKTISDNNQNS